MKSVYLIYCSFPLIPVESVLNPRNAKKTFKIRSVQRIRSYTSVSSNYILIFSNIKLILVNRDCKRNKRLELNIFTPFVGSKLEKELYGSLNVTDFVQRLLIHRCASFFGRNDRFQLITGETGYGGFLEVGSDNEKAPLILKNVLSYDEIKVNYFPPTPSY